VFGPQGFGLHVGWAIEGAIGSEFKARRSHSTTLVVADGAEPFPVQNTQQQRRPAFWPLTSRHPYWPPLPSLHHPFSL
jgi:TPP-dependent 2-oxoacid decarboxylase